MTRGDAGALFAGDPIWPLTALGTKPSVAGGAEGSWQAGHVWVQIPLLSAGPAPESPLLSPWLHQAPPAPALSSAASHLLVIHGRGQGASPAPHSLRGPSPQPQKVEFNAGGFASQEFLRPHNAQLGFEKASGLKCNRKLDKPAQGPQTMGCSSLLSFTACEGPARRVTSHALEMLLAWTPAGRAPLCGSRSGEQPERQAEPRDISARSRG